MSSVASDLEGVSSSVAEEMNVEDSSDPTPVNCEETEGGEARKRKKKTSIVWSNFKVLKEDPTKAKCDHCSLVMSLNKEGTTTHLKRHVEKNCEARRIMLAKEAGEKVSNPTQTLLSFFENHVDPSATLSTYKYDEEKIKDICAMMIMVHEYAFMVVEHELFRMYSKALNPCFKPICRQAIRDHCMVIYEKEKKKLKSYLSSVGRISLTSDLWTSNQTKGYMCITAHYVDANWKIQCRILNFCEFPPPHTGTAISDFIYKCLSEWGIEDKVCTITFDNASSNNVAVRCMRDILQGSLLLQGLIFHVRCCAHVINLMVQDGLLQIRALLRMCAKLLSILVPQQD